MSILTALALIIFIIEVHLPSLSAIPGIKLGLANIITLIALVFLGRKQAGLILAMRIILGSIFAGSVGTIIFSGAGGVLCYIVMSLTVYRFPQKQLWVVSILGAIAHNIGQLLAAALVMRTAAVFAYTPVLLISAVISGSFTGLCAVYICKYQKWING